MNLLTEDIKLIYEKLSDDISRDIFTNRLAYCLTGDVNSLKRLIDSASGGGAVFRKRLDEVVAEGREICIFGAGTQGRNILESNPDIGFSCFVDNDIKRCGDGESIPIIHFDEWQAKKKGSVIIISSKLFHEQQYSQLKQCGIPDELIINAGKIIDESNRIQYFDLPELREYQVEDEVFVDAGAFDGITSEMFDRWAGKYKKIYALEPDPQNIEKCRKRLDSIEAVYEIVPFGVWDKRDELTFVANMNGASHMQGYRERDAGEQISIKVDKLDNLINDKVTFLKMDIEGTEIHALKGAERIIKNDRPKLAISIYHNKEDIWEIPKLIMSYVPEYRFYIRHYSISANETVLYGVVK